MPTVFDVAHPYDLVVIDIDGTLLNAHGTVSPANRNAIERLAQHGIEVIIATGRALAESRHTLEQIAYDGLVVTAGGSMLCEADSGRTVDRCVIPQHLVVQASEILLKHRHKPLLLKDRQVAGYDYLAVGPHSLDPASEWWFESLPVDVRFVHELEDDPHPEDTVRLGIVAMGEAVGPVAEELTETLGSQVMIQHWPAVTSSQAIGSETHLLEAFGPNVNKWMMVQSHCRREMIDPQRVMAIGDGLNDVELLSNAGLGVAMGNAMVEALQVADRVTSHHDEDGVACAIDHMLTGRW